MNQGAQEPAERTSGETLRERYEDLRSLVLSGTPSWGRAVEVGSLLCGGMRNWMERGSQAFRRSPSGAPSSRVKVTVEPAQAQLGAVIAEMILAPLRRAFP